MKATQQVLAERELALRGRAAVGEHVVRLHLVAQADDRLLVDQRPLVRAHELDQLVLVLAVLRLDDDLVGVHVDDRAGRIREDDVTGIHGGAVLEPGSDQRRVRDQQRYRLALHVRAHERAVRVVVLEERDQRRAH